MAPTAGDETATSHCRTIIIMAHANPLKDMLLRTGVNAEQSIDLKAAFGDTTMTFTLKNGDGDVVAANIVDGVLTLKGDQHGFSDLIVTGISASGTTVTDNVRVHVAGENAFTVAVLPDTQNYTSNASLNHIFGDMTSWLVDNADSRNIQFVVGVGDITDNNLPAQWAIAEDALRRLDGKIPYSMLPGNHDQASGGSAGDHSTNYLDSVFSPDKQAATNPDTFGGVYDREPTRSANTFHTFQAPDGTKWLVLSMEFGPRDDVLRWAGDVIEGHLDHRIIIASHTLTTYAGRSDAFAGQIGAAPVQGYGIGNSAEGANDGESVYRQLTSKYPNVAITLSGHVLGDSAETNISYSQHGNSVAEIMADYQNGSTSELISRGGEGAIRLLVIDPDAGTVSMDTYITERDEYLTGYRGKEELDRDGLTGPYRGHQETIGGLDLKTPELKAQADAGGDLFIKVAGDAGSASVQLDGSGTLNRSLASSYEWRDADGRVLSTEALAKVDLGVGKHALTLVVTDLDGQETRDEMVLVVSGPGTLLTDNFNDGDARGWGPVPVPDFSEALEFGSAEALGLPGMLGGSGDVMGFPAASPTTEGFLIRPDFGTPAGQTIKSYTLVVDMLVKAEHAGKWFALLQTDPAQSSANDADVLINKSGGIGINGSYTGSFTYDAWHRVGLTVTETTGGNMTLAKYIDGVLVGSQSMPASRFQIDPGEGFLVFSDNAPNGSDLQTQPGFVSSVLFADRAMTGAEISALGGAKADGILTTLPTAGHVVQFDFASDAPFAPSLGSGSFTVVEPQSILEHTKFGTTDTLGSAPMPGGSEGIMEIPATPTDQGYLIKPGFGPADGGPIKSYTFMVDVYAPAAKGHWLALLQTDPTNTSDADFLVNMSGGIGIGGNYTGSFKTDQWQRVGLTVTDNGNGTSTLNKYLEGQLVGTQSMDTSRYQIDPEKGFFIFTDEGHFQWNFETAPAQINSVFFSDQVLTTAEIGQLGGAKAGGIVAPAGIDTAHAVQFDFNQGDLSPSYGPGSLELWDRATSGTYLDGWSVKGSVNAPGAEAGEGALHDRSDAAGKLLLWQGKGAEDWHDYRYDVTLTSTDNDEIGVAFYYQDAANHYRFTMNTQTMVRELVRVENGTETVLAEARAGYRFNDALDLSVVTTQGRVDVLLDGKSVFGGPVVDANPLTGGTVGVYSSGQKSSIFDNVVVNKVALTAHGEAAMRVLADEGARSAEVVVTAASSFGPGDISAYRWLVDGKVVGNGREAMLDLAVGTEAVTLEVTDSSGRTSTDLVAVDIIGGGDVLVRDGFSNGLSSAWRIVDEGTLEGPSDWQVQNGRLFQNSNIYSEQLVANGPSNPDNWQKGWSPLGDGTYVLRKGTTALYQPEGQPTEGWKDYSVEADFHTPDDDGLGFVFYYQNPDNHYKLELDAQRGVWTLVRLVQGVEEVLGQAWGGYAVGQESHLRVDVQDHKISAYLNDEAIFPLPIEDRALSGGTVGLYSWGSKGVSFDNVAVVSLVNDAPVLSGDLRLDVAEGSTVVLIAADLAAVDADDAAADLTFAVADISHGEVLVDGVAATSFTQAQLTAGQVAFRHDGSETTEASFGVSLSDGGEDGTQPVTARISVVVAPVNDAPVIAAPAKVAIEEGRSDVTTITATDAEGDPLSFSLTGSDAKLFTIDEDGHLRFNTAPDWEKPSDSDGNNLYDLLVRASDGVAVTEHALSVAVTDVQDGSAAGFELVGLNDWYNPSWGGGFNASFRYTVQAADLVGGEVSAWEVLPNYDGPGRITSAWASGFNGSVKVGANAEGEFSLSTVGQSHKPTLHAGDRLDFSVQVQDAGFKAENFTFAFEDLDRPAGSVDPGAMQISAQRTNDWGAGLSQNVTLRNAGDQAINGWKVELDVATGVDLNLTNVWGANAAKDAEGDIVFTAMPWNTTLATNGAANFGFNATYSGSNGLQFDSSDFSLIG